MIIYVHKRGPCPGTWTAPSRLRRLVDLQKSVGKPVGFYYVGGHDPEEGPTHRVETLDEPDSFEVTIYGPDWMLDAGDWTDTVSESLR